MLIRKNFLLLIVLIFVAYNTKGENTRISNSHSLSITISDEKKELELAVSKFKAASGSTDDHEIVALINQFKKIGKSSNEVINIISLKLKENDILYQNRGPKEVERLRGYLIASLSEIGINERIIPILKAELTFGYHPYLVAAAARASGKILDSNQSSFVPLLVKYLDQNYKDDYVDLDNYDLSWPLKMPTTARLEVVKSLAKIGNGENSLLAQIALQEIVESKEGTIFASDTLLINNSKKALERLKITVEDHSMHHIATAPSDKKGCCSETSAIPTENVTWINPANRKKQHLKAWKAVDQNGNNFYLKNIIGQPFMLTFFYSRCDNPNKCSASIGNLAKLQKDLKNLNLAKAVNLYAITYDPEYDSPSIVKSYGLEHGVVFDENIKFLKLEEDTHKNLLKEVSVLVNYGKGLVNTHGNQIYIFDKQGRLAKLYENTAWRNDKIVDDFKVLIEEK